MTASTATTAKLTHSPDPSEEMLQVGYVLRAARKTVGLQQSEVAKRLGITQGYLSKLETGQMVPDAILWFRFCDLVNIPYESLKTGFIDFLVPAMLRDDARENGFKLPKQYARNRGTKVRALLPLLDYAKESLGNAKYLKLLEAHELSPEFFVHLDSQIGINFYFDLISALLEKNVITKQEFPKLMNSASSPASHGGLRRIYDQTDSSPGLMLEYFRNIRHYDCDFDYKVLQSSEKLLEIEVKPLAHVPSLHPIYAGHEFCELRRHYLESISSYRGMSGMRVVETSCTHSGASSCIYQLKSKLSA